MVAEDKKYFHLQIKDSLNSFQILRDNNHFSFHSQKFVNKASSPNKLINQELK